MQFVKDFVHEALIEDIGRGDLFSRCVQPIMKKAIIKAKQDGIFAGEMYARELCDFSGIKYKFLKHDSDSIKEGELILELEGNHTTLLACERTLLNMMQHCSGIATNANKYVQILKGSNIKLLDTRKTRPLLRRMEKYATRVGGATNHRMGLDDCLMLKDTHQKSIDNLREFIINARIYIPITSTIEVECNDSDTARIALECGVEFIMCDNMDLENIKDIIRLRDEISPSTQVEVSGNVTLKNIEIFKHIGVNSVSTGSMIHQATWIDFSMKML